VPAFGATPSSSFVNNSKTSVSVANFGAQAATDSISRSSHGNVGKGVSDYFTFFRDLWKTFTIGF
jgi:hypothetical protein